MIDRDCIERAKAALPLPDLWRKLGWPGEPKKSCRRPYSPEDSRESASVFQRSDGSWLLHDFKSGESFDEIALLGRMEGLETGDAIRRFCTLAGVAADAPRSTEPRIAARPHAAPSPLRVETKPERKPWIPALREPTLSECETIAGSRGLLLDAVMNAASDGLLFIGERLGLPCWVLTDAERWNAQSRALSGEPFKLADGRTVKTLGAKGGWAAWPIGWPLLAGERIQNALLCEGPPDALAAYQIALEAGRIGSTAIVCMTGAGLRIPSECLPAFEGKRCRIFCDVDASGKAAALRWEGQLRDAGASVDAFDLGGLLQADGRAVKDLNDACRMAADERAALKLMEGMEA